jgi:hypothetical protein
MERPIRAPAIYFEVMVERKDIAGPQLPGKMNQASVGKIHFTIAILAKQPLQGRGRLRQLQRDMKYTGSDIFQDCLGGSRLPTQQLAALCDNCFAGN